MSLKLTSRAFQNEAIIPDKHAKQGGNILHIWHGRVFLKGPPVWF